MNKKIGFGGGCHWCTEAVFQTLKGVQKVAQGWIASNGESSSFSEAVIVYFDSLTISLEDLIAVHLHTHSCTSMHPMRAKYRSAVYTFSDTQATKTKLIIETLQFDFENSIITQVLPFVDFRENEELYQNYYQKNYDNRFCKTYIHPKFRLLMEKFSTQIDKDKLKYF